MKQYLISLILLVLFVGISCQKEVDIEADIAAIKELWNKYREAEVSGDIDLWISLWTDDAIRMPPNTPAVYGKERIRETVQSFFDQVNRGDYTIMFTIKTEEIIVTGDWAFARGTFKFSTYKKEGEERNGDGKYLSILERQADGSWKLARDCFSHNTPPQE